MYKVTKICNEGRFKMALFDDFKSAEQYAHSSSKSYTITDLDLNTIVEKKEE